MDMDLKLDQDFLFYLDFVKIYLGKIEDPILLEKCQDWVMKLCAEPCSGIDMKRCRNIYLSQLLLQMQDNKLKKEFLQNPVLVDISNAMEVFQPIGKDIEESWLSDVKLKKRSDPNMRDVGNTVIATRTLPNGQGAFAYIGISLDSCEPVWLNQEGAGDLAPVLSQRRKPQERQNIFNFLDSLIAGIDNEISGKVLETSDVVENCLESLVEDLKNRGQYSWFEDMDDEHDRRMGLLEKLKERVEKTREEVKDRTEALDTLVTRINPMTPTTFNKSPKRCKNTKQRSCSFGNTYVQLDPTNPLYPDMSPSTQAFWAEMETKAPVKKEMISLLETYPENIIETFEVFLTEQKKDLRILHYKRRGQLERQMLEEMKITRERNLLELERAEDDLKLTRAIHDHIKTRYDKIERMKNADVEEEMDTSKYLIGINETLGNYEKSISMEVSKGSALAKDLNATHEQIEKYKRVSHDILHKTKVGNKRLQYNIEKLQETVMNHTSKFTQMKETLKSLPTMKHPFRKAKPRSGCPASFM